MKNTTIFRGVLILLILVTLTACNMNRQDGQGAGQQNPQDNVRNFAHNFTNTAKRDLNQNNNQNNTQNNRNNARGTQTPHNNTTVEMSQEIAERIAAMPEVDRANVLLTNRNAYIAVVVSESTRKDNDNNSNQRTNRANRDGGFVEREIDVVNAPDEVYDQLKDRIAKQVQSMNPKVNNVYVSTNPDFVDRTNEFMQQVQEGRPVRGFIEEFNTMVQRIFPENSGQR